MPLTEVGPTKREELGWGGAGSGVLVFELFKLLMRHPRCLGRWELPPEVGGGDANPSLAGAESERPQGWMLSFQRREAPWARGHAGMEVRE